MVWQAKVYKERRFGLADISLEREKVWFGRYKFRKREKVWFGL